MIFRTPQVPSFGLLGAGRLGTAIVRRARAVNAPLAGLYSRRYEQSADTRQGAPGPDRAAVIMLEDVFAHQVVMVAIPNDALADLGKRHAFVAGFRGVILASGIDRSAVRLGEVIPAAQIVRVAPLVGIGDEIPCLVLEPGVLDARWFEQALPLLTALFHVRLMADEAVFELGSIFSTPLTTVLKAALSDSIFEAFEGINCAPERRTEIARELRQVMDMVLPGLFSDADLDFGAVVATPGGITEAGLKHRSELAGQFTQIIRAMAARM